MAKTILAQAAFAVALVCGAPALAAEPGANPGSARPDGAALQAETDAAAPGTAATTTAAPETPSWETAPATRRAGFAVGVQLSAALGNVTGYPNDLRKVGRAEYRADLGAAFGGSATVWLGGALADWLVFGVGLGGSRLEGNGAVAQGVTFLFHTEVFPLFTLGGRWRDLGISLDTGAGNIVADLSDKPAGSAGKLIPALIDSGAASRVGASIFYDGLRLWKVSAGPFVSFDYTWSGTLSQPLALVGWRTALYAKAKK